MKEKTIKTTYIMASGETIIIEGLATRINVQKNGLPEKHSARIEIQNLKLASMEQMTFLAFKALEAQKNHVMVEAGAKGEDLSMVFKGDVTSAFADFSTAPDVTFRIEAITAGWSVKMNTSPTSVNGEATAASLIEQFAGEAGFGFINHGVDSSVRDTTFNGSPVTKAQQVADEVGAQLIIDDENFVLMKWDEPQGEAVLLKPDSGLIGYPGFVSDGIALDCFYNPKLQLGGQVKVESIVPRASGSWKIYKLTHSLAAYTDGDWRSHVEASWLE